MLLHARGIDLDARDGVDTTRVGAGHRQDRRHSIGDARASALRDWWSEHRERISADREHPEHLDALVEVLAGNIDRRGYVYVDPVEALVPGTWSTDYGTASAVHAALLALERCGGIAIHRPRRGRHRIEPAPWIEAASPAS